MRAAVSIALLVATNSLVHAQALSRDPYLQSPTPHGITIMWRTGVVTNTRVWLGPHPDSLVLYTSSGNLVTNHIMRLTGLQAHTRYYYGVGANNTILAGGDSAHCFRTFPEAGDPGPVRVWALGDFGRGNTEQVNVKNSFTAMPEAMETDAWIWLGDNAYNDGKDNEYQEKVFGLQGFRDIFGWLPFYPTPGNHDYNEVWQESTFFGIPYSNISLDDHHGPYYDIVSVPQQGEAGGHPSGLELFYSFDLGDAHFISLNSEVYDFLGTGNGIDRMLDWLEQDLQQNDRLFTIAYFHQPPYSKGSHNSDGATEFVMRAMRERVVPMLENFDVDLVICGHSHVYERSHLIHGHYGYSDSFDPATMLRDGGNGNFDQGTPYHKDGSPATPDGTVYVVCGNGGSSEGEPALNHPVMAVTHGGGGVCGSFLIEIEGNRLDGRYIGVDGSIGDDFTIIKQADPIAVNANAAISAHIYPNPAQGELHIWLKDPPGSGSLHLVDATGREVLAQAVRDQRTTVDLHHVASGSYQLVLDLPQGRISKRVVVE